MVVRRSLQTTRGVIEQCWIKLVSNIITICICLAMRMSTGMLWAVDWFLRSCPDRLKRVLRRLRVRFGISQQLFRWHDEEPCLASLRQQPQSVEEICATCGIAATQYNCSTLDGYLLTLIQYRRIKEDSSLPPLSERPTALLVHGLLQDSDSFVCGGESSIVHNLLVSGVDVWVGNNRGTRYSKSHSAPETHHHAQSERYWDFCIDQLALFDIPAMVDAVLAGAEKRKLVLIGFSQGSAQSLGALSVLPGLNDKVALCVALAPAAKVGAPSSLSSSSSSSSSSFQDAWLSHLVGAYPQLLSTIFGRMSMLPFVLDWQRLLSEHIFERAVLGSMSLLFGWDCFQIAQQRRLDLFQHVYSTSSVKCVAHWLHIMKHGGVLTPFGTSPVKQYDFARIACPVAVFAGSRDFVVDASYIPSCVSDCVHFHVQDAYEHLDLIWADTAPSHIFLPIAELIHRHVESKAAS